MIPAGPFRIFFFVDFSRLVDPGERPFRLRGRPLAPAFSQASAFSVMVAAVLSLACVSAFAGRPLTTDDATITDDRHCQLESWMQRDAETTEYWAAPACNFTGNLEWMLGAARMDDDVARNLAVVQAKTVLKPLQPGGWGAAIAFGRQSGDADADDLYVNLPVSFSYDDDRLLVHVNAGWLHADDGADDLATWGLAAQWHWTDRTDLAAETFRQNVGKPYYQLSISHQWIPGRVQVDGSYGNRLDGHDGARFFSVGLVLFTDMIIP